MALVQLLLTGLLGFLTLQKEKEAVKQLLSLALILIATYIKYRYSTLLKYDRVDSWFPQSYHYY